MNDKPLRICIVEDHQDTRELLLMLLAQEGHQVQAVASCKAARGLLAGAAFDVLLSDIGLPDGDGWTLLTSLDARARPPCAIAMSGFGAPDDRARSTAAGFRHHLTKPLDLADLCALLQASRAAADVEG